MSLEIKNPDVCYVCGSKHIDTSSSLHVWVMKYECGCEIWGAFSYKEVALQTQCPKE